MITDRERQVVCLLAYPNAQIARFLGIATRTVRQYILLAGIRMGVAAPITRGKVILKALELGQVTLQDVEVGDYRFQEDDDGTKRSD